LSPVTTDEASSFTATLLQEVSTDSGSIPWYMINDVAVLPYSYSKVVIDIFVKIKQKQTIAVVMPILMS